MEKIAIIGAGNLGAAIARGIAKAGIKKAEDIVLTKKRKHGADDLRSEGFMVTSENSEAVKSAGLVILCVQPKQIAEVLSGIDKDLNEKHILISVATGVSIDEIKIQVSLDIPIVRAMPNTAVAIGQSMTCIASSDLSEELLGSIVQIFESLGEVLVIEERMMQAATVLGASGIAFFMRYLRAATQGGIEMGFHPEEAQKIAVQTAKGAAGLIITNGNHPEVEIDRVTTPQGCTIAGLNEMEHQGLSSALIKGLLTSYEKIKNIK